MPLPEQTQRVDSQFIYRPLWEASLILLDACEKRGARYYMISGYRSIPEQNGLYAQGRTKPGAIVTNARGGQSYHNQGLALDFCRDKDRTRAGLQPAWDTEEYRILAEEAQKIKTLESGFFWRFQDAPHVQWRLPVGVALFRVKHIIPSACLEDINPDGSKLQDVFAFLDGQSSAVRS
jgi:peptidoglycan L-alanyl-D-glutamate endopeptidase CwlK